MIIKYKTSSVYMWSVINKIHYIRNYINIYCIILIYYTHTIKLINIYNNNYIISVIDIISNNVINLADFVTSYINRWDIHKQHNIIVKSVIRFSICNNITGQWIIYYVIWLRKWLVINKLNDIMNRLNCIDYYDKLHTYSDKFICAVI